MRPQKNHTSNTTQTNQEQITAVYSWIQKNEQMIASLSGRLAVLETRLSLLISNNQQQINPEPKGPTNQEHDNNKDQCKWTNINPDLTTDQTPIQDHEPQRKTLADEITSLDTLSADNNKRESRDNISNQIDIPTQQKHVPKRETIFHYGSILLIVIAITTIAYSILNTQNILANPLLLACLGITSPLAVILKMFETKKKDYHTPSNLHSPQTESFEDPDEEPLFTTLDQP